MKMKAKNLYKIVENCLIEIDSEEEEFQDILRMVSNKLKSKEESTFTLTEIETKKNSKKKKSKNKNNNKKIIFDMNSEDSNEKKGWRSKRMREKKGPEVIKRKFKPRLPPPGNKFKNLKKKIKVNINLDTIFLHYNYINKYL